MPAPSNTSSGTATELAPLDKTVVQQVDDAGITYTVWYKYTAEVGVDTIGILAFGDITIYTPTLHVYGPNSAVTSYLGGFDVVNLPLQIPVTSGAVYYFRVTPNAGNPTPAILTISALKSPTATIVDGSLMVPDDDPGDFHATILSPTTPTVLRLVPILSGELGDTTVQAILVDDPSNAAVVNLYDMTTFALLSAITLPSSGGETGTGAIRSNNGTNFYVGRKKTGGAIVRKISDAGVVSGTTWTLPANSTPLWTMALDTDETVLYYVKTAGTPQAVRAYDLVNNIALPDLVPAQTPFNVTQDMIVLKDGTVLIGYHESGDYQVRRYAATGTLLNTYDFGDVFAAGTLAYRMTRAPDDPVSFWVWTVPPAPPIVATYTRVKVSDGSTVVTYTITPFEFGIGQMTPSASPARFGPSESCPLLLLRTPTATTPVAPPGIPGDCCIITPSTLTASPSRSSGCNAGGVGWLPTYAAASGVVPIGADPNDGEPLTGKRAVHLWAEVTHVLY